MTNLFKKLVFTDKAIDDLTVAVQAGKSIVVERAVLSGWNPPDDDQVYTPYKNSSGALDVAAVKANINKYFAKSEALKATTTPTPYIEGIVKLKTVKKDNKNILSFALDFENLNFDHDVAVKFFGYESWAALIASEKELTSDCKCLALLAQDDAGLEYIFAFAKLASGQQLKYPLALTEELTHRLHVDLFISINQSDNIVIKYTPDGFVEYNEFAQHVANAEDVYAKKIDVYTKVESDNSFLTKSDAAATYTTKTENAKKANSSDVYTKTESDGRFARSATINGGTKVTPNSSGNLDLTVDLNNYATKEDVNKKANTSDVYTKTAADARFVRGAKVNDGPTVTPNSDGTLELNVPNPDLSNYATKEDVNKKANTSDVYTKTESDGRFARSATINGGAKVTPNTEGNLALTVNVGVKKVNNTAPDANGNVATIKIFDTNAEARDYSAQHPNVLTGVLL